MHTENSFARTTLANGEDLDEMRMHRLVRALTACQCYNCHNLVCMPNFILFIDNLSQWQIQRGFACSPTPAAIFKIRSENEIWPR